MNRIIQLTDYGVYGVPPERCPLCPECDMPLEVGDDITLQTCAAGLHRRDLVRLVHTHCADASGDDAWDEDEDE